MLRQPSPHQGSPGVQTLFPHVVPSTNPGNEKKKIDGVDLFTDVNVVLELVGNLYGRGPAGNNCSREFEEVVVHKMASKRYDFRRGKRDPTVYTCTEIGATIVHHVDDLRKRCHT